MLGFHVWHYVPLTDLLYRSHGQMPPLSIAEIKFSLLGSNGCFDGQEEETVLKRGHEGTRSGWGECFIKYSGLPGKQSLQRALPQEPGLDTGLDYGRKQFSVICSITERSNWGFILKCVHWATCTINPIWSSLSYTTVCLLTGQILSRGSKRSPLSVLPAPKSCFLQVGISQVSLQCWGWHPRLHMLGNHSTHHGAGLQSL